MPERRLVRLASSAERLALAADWLADRARRHDELLLLAPGRGAADALAHEVCRRNSALLGLHRLTPYGLAAGLATPELARRGLVPISGLAAQALCARCTQQVVQAGSLEYFAPVATLPGFARALSRTLHELRMHGVRPPALEALGPTGRDLARLLAALEQELAACGMADLARIHELAAEGEGPWLGLPLLLLDVSPATPLEERLYARLALRSPDVLATLLPQDDDAGLRRALGCEPESLDPPQTPRALDRVQRLLFGPAPAASQPAGDDTVQFFSALGEGRECVEIARRARLAAEQGVPFERMAILLRNPQRYQPLVEEALRRAGIPGWFARGTLRPDPAGRAFLALLACRRDGLSASGFAEYLSLGQLPPDPGGRASWSLPGSEQPWLPKTPPGQPGDPAPRPQEATEGPVIDGTLRAPLRWERLLIDAAVIGGKQRWERRLAGLQRELELRLRESEAQGRRAAVERQLEELRHLAGFALPIVGALDGLPEGGPWGEWIAALQELAARALRDPSPVLAVLAELGPMAEVGPVGIDEVYELLGERLSFLREPRARRAAGVFVGTPEDARGRAFELVFLPGLTEGVFPRKVGEDPLLLDEQRRALGAAAGLPGLDERGRQERLRLHAAVGAASGRLVTSYPRADVVAGRARVPSFYALDVLRAAEGALPDLRALERRAAEADQAASGWPAPRDPELALDEAEFDLATLWPLVRQTAEQSKGRARYLLDANPHLQRSLRHRWLRWRGAWTQADGLVAPGERARAALERHRLSARAYSPTALQKYAACPYRFLLYAIFGLRPREVAAALEQIDPLTRGSLFHQVQFELFGALDRAGLLPVTPERLESALDLADRTLDAVARASEEKLAPAIPRVWQVEIEELRIDLRAWLRSVAGEHDGWLPAQAELAFGLAHRGEPRDPASRPEPVAVTGAGYLLRGSIDLVERHPARGVVRVTDHKTGRAPHPAPRQTGGGEILQPLLYALVAEALQPLAVDSGRLFYCTQRGGFAAHDIPLDAAGRRQIESVLQQIDGALASGFLPAAPRQDACAWCDYRPVCGPYEELRTGYKSKRELAGLFRIREQP